MPEDTEGDEPRREEPQMSMANRDAMNRAFKQLADNPALVEAAKQAQKVSGILQTNPALVEAAKSAQKLSNNPALMQAAADFAKTSRIAERWRGQITGIARLAEQQATIGERIAAELPSASAEWSEASSPAETASIEDVAESAEGLDLSGLVRDLLDASRQQVEQTRLLIETMVRASADDQTRAANEVANARRNQRYTVAGLVLTLLGLLVTIFIAIV